MVHVPSPAGVSVGELVGTAKVVSLVTAVGAAVVVSLVAAVGAAVVVSLVVLLVASLSLLSSGTNRGMMHGNHSSADLVQQSVSRGETTSAVELQEEAQVPHRAVQLEEHIWPWTGTGLASEGV